MSKKLVLSLVLAVGSFATAPAFAGGGKCVKDGKALKVKGKNAKLKQKKCEAKGGTWEGKDAAPKDDSFGSQQEESSGGGSSSGGGESSGSGGGGW